MFPCRPMSIGISIVGARLKDSATSKVGRQDFVMLPGGRTEQTSPNHCKTDGVPRQPQRKKLHQEEKQMASSVDCFSWTMVFTYFVPHVWRLSTSAASPFSSSVAEFFLETGYRFDLRHADLFLLPGYSKSKSGSTRTTQAPPLSHSVENSNSISWTWTPTRETPSAKKTVSPGEHSRVTGVL